MTTNTDMKAADDKRVEIRMTEAIVPTDTPADIETKRARLVVSLQRHGVPAGTDTVTEDWVNGQRSLIGIGMGTPIEMTEEMEKRRKDENEAASQEALLKIAAAVQPTFADLAIAGQVATQLEEMRTLAAQAKADREAAEATLAEIRAAAPTGEPAPAPSASAAGESDAGQAASKAKTK